MQRWIKNKKEYNKNYDKNNYKMISIKMKLNDAEILDEYLKGNSH